MSVKLKISLRMLALPGALCLFACNETEMQKIIPLYDDEIPNAISSEDQEVSSWRASGADSILIIEKVSRPTLTLYLPPKEKATGDAIIICPGGGYWVLAASHEGSDVAEKFNEAGIAAFVLKYRIPNTATMKDKSIGPLQDAQRAIQLVRQNAEKWNVDPDRVGIMGFSAGGHLASTASTHFQQAYIDNPGNTSLRPDFSILGYPVISFIDSIGHMGSRDQLIGKEPDPERVTYFSNELMVDADTPPAFLVHARDDATVKVENSLLYADALRSHGTPVEVFLYDQGGHGFGMNNPTSEEKWMDRCIEWIKAGKWRK